MDGYAGITGTGDSSAVSRTAHLKKSPTGKWEIHWSEPTGPGQPWRTRRISTRTADRAQAQAALEAFRKHDQLATEQARTDRYTVSELIDYYVTHHAFQKTATAREALMAVDQLLGTLVPSALTPQRIAAYRVARRAKRPIKDGTLRRELGALVAALNYAKKHELISKVPAIDLPPQSHERVVFMDAEQAQYLWDQAMTWPGYKGSGRRIKLFTALALETAARAEAIHELTWDRVNFKNRTVDYKVPGRPDTKKQRIVLPMSDRLYDVLMWGAQSDPHPKSRVIGAGSIRTAWENFTEGVGMGWVTPHVCRHTWATLAFADGVPLGKIAAVLGDTVTTVTRNYVHPQTEHLRDVVNRKRGTP